MAGPDDIINSPEDPYVSGVLETAGDIPVAFIDPNKFEGLNIDLPNGQYATADDITAEHLQMFKDALDENAPGFSDNLDPDVLKAATLQAINDGPRAFTFDYNDQRYCVVNGFHDSISAKEDVLPLVAHESPENLGAIPGSDAEWMHLFGRHEGATCDDPATPAFENEDERVLFELQGETANDRVAIQDPDGHISPDVIETYIDARGLVVGDENDDFDHANGIFLDDPSSGTPTQEHVDAARSVVPAMVQGVAYELRIDEDSARQLREDNPEMFTGVVQDLLDRNYFDTDTTGQQNEHVQTYIQDYVDAYRDQVLDEDHSSLSPMNDIIQHGQIFYDDSSPKTVGDGSPIVVTDLTQSQMQLGQDGAGDYFAKVADPALAQDRMEMMAGMDSTDEQDFTLSSGARLG